MKYLNLTVPRRAVERLSAGGAGHPRRQPGVADAPVAVPRPVRLPWNRPTRRGRSEIATEVLLAQVLVSKHADGLPLYRQAQISARQGVELDRSTLCAHGGLGRRLLRRRISRSAADGSAGRAGAWSRCGACCAGTCRARPGSSPTTRPCRCSIPVAGGPRPAAWGATPSTTRAWQGIPPPAVVFLDAEDRKGGRPAVHKLARLPPRTWKAGRLAAASGG
jgi:hypothetical protein